MPNLVLWILLLVPQSVAFGPLEPQPRATANQDSDVESEIRAAGEDTAALLALAAGYASAGRKQDAERAYERVLELDSENVAAREALRHQRYDGRWFESYVELSRYKRETEARMREQGLEMWNDEWVPVADYPFLRMGWVRDAEQRWLHPLVLRQREQADAWSAAGYQFRPDDSSWVAPEDFERWAAVEWKCGDEWLDLEAADAYHSRLERPWALTGENFVVLTTCGWNFGNSARWYADQIAPDLVRLFGTEPAEPPTVLVLNALEQYNTAATDTLLDADGYSSLHGAYFADAATAQPEDAPPILPIGVSYWDQGDPQVGAWGPYWLRWAAAQSFVDAIDPSWIAISALLGEDEAITLEAYTKRFWEEKRIPRWLRYGAASYCERFLKNPDVDPAAEGADPWNLRTFAFAELAEAGGLRDLEELFEFGLDMSEPESSARLYNEAGAVVSFLLDGAPDDGELRAAHEAWRVALAGADDDERRAAIATLEDRLVDRSDAIRAFAGL